MQKHLFSQYPRVFWTSILANSVFLLSLWKKGHKHYRNKFIATEQHGKKRAEHPKEPYQMAGIKTALSHGNIM